MKALNQLKHDTRIWYHGTAASKACLQTTSPFSLHQTTAGLASLADFFLFDSVFCLFPPTAEPGEVSG